MANPIDAGAGGASWDTFASGDSNNPPNLGLDPGDYRMTINLPIAIPDWVLGWFRGVPGVKAITAVGQTLTIYFRV